MLRIMIDGFPVVAEDARISVMDYGFLFGHSIYEVLKTKNGRLFAAGLHMERLRYSSEMMNIALPVPPVQLREEMQVLVDAMTGHEVQLRLVITAGSGPPKMDVTRCSGPLRIVYAWPLEAPDPKLRAEGVRLCLSQVHSENLQLRKGHYKAGNHSDRLIELRSAHRQGFYETLFTNHDAHISECATANIFWVKGGNVFTPSLEVGILNGITRQIVFAVCAQNGLTIQEGAWPLEEIFTAEEVFLTSTTRDVLPIRAIDTHVFALGPVTRTLAAWFDNYAD